MALRIAQKLIKNPKHVRKGRAGKPITGIVLLSEGAKEKIEGLSDRSLLEFYESAAAKSAVHYYVTFSGNIEQYVPDEDTARYSSDDAYNRVTIAIQHQDNGFTDAPGHYTDAQYAASAQLVVELCKKYRIPIRHAEIGMKTGIILHREIPGVAQDPTSVKVSPFALNWQRILQMAGEQRSPTMETLFRFVLTRPPVAQDEGAPSIKLSQNTPFQAALGQAQQNENPRETLKAIIRRFVAEGAVLSDPQNLPTYVQLKTLGASLDALESMDEVTNDVVQKAVEDAFGLKPAALVERAEITNAASLLKDTLILIKLYPELHRLPVEEFANQLRDLETVLKAASNKDFPGSGVALRQYRRRSLALPTTWELRSTLSTVRRQQELEKQRQEAEAKRRAEAEAKLNKYRRLKAATDELTRLTGKHFYETQQEPNAGFLPPAEVRPVQVFTQQLQQLFHQDLPRIQPLLDEADNQDTVEDERSVINLPMLHPSEVIDAQERMFISGQGAFKPVSPAETAFRLKPTAVEALSENTRTLLRERSVDISEAPLDRIVDQLETETLTLTEELDALLGRPVQRTFKRVGNTMVMISTPAASVWNNMVVGSIYEVTPVLPMDLRIPHSHGSVAPVGVADLLVVKQQLVRYEATDVAHIENVLKGEKKEREHTRRRETEELLFTETEITTSEERELESTNRFEMSREASETIKEDASLKAGLTVSGKYGPTVEFSASVEGSFSRSKETATKTAAEFAQDVTQRSANKITERVLERSSLRVTNEVIEKNSHLLDNTGGLGHISGVYQWVNKVYQAQMFNYGLRTMYDFMVPEPAAFLIATLQKAHANAVHIEKPTPFTLRPDQVTEANYHGWVKLYGATDVQPPPEIYITKSIDFKAGGGDSKTNYNHSGQIQIDDGYKAVHGTVGIAGNVWEANAAIDVVLGARTHRFPDGAGIAAWSTNLSEERVSLPFALKTWKYGDVAVAVEVKCQRTDRALMKWRLETHAKLTQAHKARLSEYEEKLAALELQAGVVIQGKNPALNNELMKDELKKNCISILTEQHFDLFDSISMGSYGYEQIDLFENEAEGPYVRFFEQAFEWEHMTWVTYPYFWGRKNTWDERISYEDGDPIFNQFLKAGYCRVVVPARLGFEGAIDHFMTIGELWAGGPLPPISSPLYLPIADEIAERLDRPQDEIPQGDSWLVRIPTTLVHLRADDKLPAWKQDANGNWVEA